MSDFFPNDSCQHYVSLLQDNISRMASNSSNCKNWLITLCAALLAIGASKDDIISFIWIAYIPTALFFLLDCFYLGIERRLRRVEKRLITLVTRNEKDLKDECLPYDVEKAMYQFDLPKEHKKYHNQFVSTLGAMVSWSTTPFYLSVAIIIFFIQHDFSICIG